MGRKEKSSRKSKEENKSVDGRDKGRHKSEKQRFQKTVKRKYQSYAESKDRI